MKRNRLIGRCLVALVCLGLATPRGAVAAAPFVPVQRSSPPAAAAAPVIHDVALAAGGVLNGQVVDAAGNPLAATEVRVLFQGEQVALGTTDETGRFGIAGLRGGIHHVQTTHGGGLFRLWAAGTAPPAAQPGALVVAGQNLVRGNLIDSMSWMTSPWVLAGVVGAAIAIPLALDDDSAS